LQTLHFHRHYVDASFQLVLDEDDPIGRLYTDRTGSAIHILDIAVIPERRREGIGTAILRDLQMEAAQARKNLTLYVEIFNPAQELYKRLGFHPIQDEGVYMLFEWTAE
jgi:ribosomal protein S18 acetylase RimI-like enzyme